MLNDFDNSFTTGAHKASLSLRQRVRGLRAEFVNKRMPRRGEKSKHICNKSLPPWMQDMDEAPPTKKDALKPSFFTFISEAWCSHLSVLI